MATTAQESWQLKQETVDEDQIFVRYVLDGTGAVNVVVQNGKRRQDCGQTWLSGGSVTGQATLEWQGMEDMIILTPGYEQPGMLIGAAALLLIVTVVGTSLVGRLLSFLRVLCISSFKAIFN